MEVHVYRPERLSVLVADDDRDTAESLTTLLRIWGHDTFTAYDGQTAMACAATSGPDVVILDINMPGLDGFQVAESLRSLGATGRTALIAHSGYFDDDYRAAALAAGIDHYLLKPVDPLYLRRLLEGITLAREALRPSGT